VYSDIVSPNVSFGADGISYNAIDPHYTELRLALHPPPTLLRLCLQFISKNIETMYNRDSILKKLNAQLRGLLLSFLVTETNFVVTLNNATLKAVAHHLHEFVVPELLSLSRELIVTRYLYK
jgi:hypothetical protein